MALRSPCRDQDLVSLCLSMAAEDKLSFYKPASSFERASLSQGRLAQSEGRPGPHSPAHSPAHLHHHSTEPEERARFRDTSIANGRERRARSEDSKGDASALSLADSGSGTSTNVTQDLPAVHVVRHTSPSQPPPHTHTHTDTHTWAQATHHGRFSSNFVDLRRGTVTPFERTATHTVTTHTVTPPTLTPHSQHPSSSVEGEGGDGGGRGEGGGEKGEVAVRSPSSWTGGSAHNKIKHHETTGNSKSLHLPAISEEPSSQSQQKKPRKAKGRIVPSRYKAINTTATSHQNSKADVDKLQSTKKTLAKSNPRSGSVMKPVHTGKPRPKRAPPSSAIPVPPTFQLSFNTADITTSTPVVTGKLLYQSITPHEGSFLHSTSHNNSKAATSKSKSRQTTEHGGWDLQLELLYNRLLQASYLDVKSAKSLREQERSAKRQLHVLWQEVEKVRSRKEAKRRLVETERRKAALSKALDVQESGLSPLCPELPRLQQSYSALSCALDASRHELATSGIVPTTEQQLEVELARSERLLTEIVSSLEQQVPTVVSFAESTQAAVSVLDKEFEELKKCWTELSKSSKAQVHETSLFFERKQRQRTLHVATTS